MFSTKTETFNIDNIVRLLFVRDKQGLTDVGDECRKMNDDGRCLTSILREVEGRGEDTTFCNQTPGPFLQLYHAFKGLLTLSNRPVQAEFDVFRQMFCLVVVILAAGAGAGWTQAPNV